MNSNFQVKGQPLEIVFCKKCVYSNQKVVPSSILTDDKSHSNRKFLRFNEDGVCSACETVEKKSLKKKDDIDWKEREFQLKKNSRKISIQKRFLRLYSSWFRGERFCVSSLYIKK